MDKTSIQLAGEKARNKLLDAALTVLRQKGYAATTVDDICQAAEVTKGSFFHHFESKEALAIAAAGHFAARADGIFGAAAYRSLHDPLERVLGYIDFRIAMLRGPIFNFSCLLGTFVQELYETHPAIRAVAQQHMYEHINMLERDVSEARSLYAPQADWTPHSLALHMQSVLQGSVIFAKATGDPAVAAASLQHLRQYVSLLFDTSPHGDAAQENSRD